MITLNYDLQATFDLITAHLRKQGKQSFGYLASRDRWCCLYRAPDGSKCAAGALIPDECYCAEWEGKSIRFVAPIVFHKAPLRWIELVLNLQWAHDATLGQDHDWCWRLDFKLHEVAQKFGLKFRPLMPRRMAEEINAKCTIQEK